MTWKLKASDWRKRRDGREFWLAGMNDEKQAGGKNDV